MSTSPRIQWPVRSCAWLGSFSDGNNHGRVQRSYSCTGAALSDALYIRTSRKEHIAKINLLLYTDKGPERMPLDLMHADQSKGRKGRPSAVKSVPKIRLRRIKLYTTGGPRLQQVPDADATHAYLMEEKMEKDFKFRFGLGTTSYLIRRVSSSTWASVMVGAQAALLNASLRLYYPIAFSSLGFGYAGNKEEERSPASGLKQQPSMIQNQLLGYSTWLSVSRRNSLVLVHLFNRNYGTLESGRQELMRTATLVLPVPVYSPGEEKALDTREFIPSSTPARLLSSAAQPQRAEHVDPDVIFNI
ncbi:hypothetical protein EDD18DRAFT_1334289 [Armillaria luteobubalina]|uniref:Uncharacterized protein n=1 Tax=Armillaria luteobubalina TaxID=153913 RepID=A0AA39PYU1_9AGAR|nr:hypothetical protein EDD18DRAFT_1334289 [Armillaria luteobubalina]